VIFLPEIPKFKGLKRGPFRRPTKPNEIQTLDIGVGKGRRFVAKAAKRPEREYVGVDLSIDVEDVNGKNYKVFGSTRANDYLKQCVDNSIKVRNINFDLPRPVGDVYRIEEFFKLLPKVLLPNGKVFMNSESPEYLDSVSRIALAKGYSVRRRELPLREYLAKAKGRLGGTVMSEYMEQFFTAHKFYKTLYVLEITYPLKLAYPNDRLRRKVWPH